MRTNKKHFAEFRRIFMEYAEAFGLGSWSINFVHSDCEDGTNAGITSNDIEDRTICAILSREVQGCTIHELAKHEAIEFLVNRYDEIARARFCSRQQLDEARHELIYSIERIIP